MIVKVLLLVMFLQLCVTRQNHNASNTRKNQDFWSWGYVDETTSKPRLQVLEATTTTTESPLKLYSNGFMAFHGEDPCEPYEPQVPDFSAPGRRISQVKCYEFIWNKQQRQENSMNSCAQKRKYEMHLEELEQLKKNVVISKPTDEPPYEGWKGRERKNFGQFSHMGGIGWISSTGKWIFKCGGALISPNFVLTAAHCTWLSTRDTTIADPVPKIVRLGDIDIINSYINYQETPKVDAIIRRIMIHPLYQYPKKNYDIALLELENEIAQFSQMLHPGCLWGEVDQESFGLFRFHVTGWSVTEEDRPQSSPILTGRAVDMIDSHLCDKLLRRHCNENWCGVTENQICAEKLSDGVGPCQGHSESLLQREIELPYINNGMYFIIGFKSFETDCSLPNTPAVYTRVASFIDWIESIVWP